MSATISHEECQGACAPNQSVSAQNFAAPEVNIFETKDGYVLEAEMPGVNKAGLEITVEGNALTIIGHRARADVTAQVLYRESSNMDYRRVFELAAC